MQPGAIIHKEPKAMTHFRELNSDTRQYLWTKGDKYPPSTQPMSAARKGNHAKAAISFRSMWRSVAMYSGIQALKVCHAGSDRKRGTAIDQKLALRTICFQDALTAVSWCLASWPARM